MKYYKDSKDNTVAISEHSSLTNHMDMSDFTEIKAEEYESSKFRPETEMLGDDLKEHDEAVAKILKEIKERKAR